jgi:hypothetical protein
VSGITAPGQVWKHEIVVNNDGSRTLRTNLINFSPHANADAPHLQAVNQTVSFSGAQSFDPDGTIASYAWDFGDGTSGVGRETSHVYVTPGNYTATLTVVDQEGANSSGQTAATILPGRRPGSSVTGAARPRSERAAVHRSDLRSGACGEGCDRVRTAFRITRHGDSATRPLGPKPHDRCDRGAPARRSRRHPATSHRIDQR